MSATRVLSLGAVAYLIAGCSGMSEQACVTADWRTVGFEDGTLGRSVGTIGSYRQQCSEHGVVPDLEGYRAGHAEGVRIYCRASNGFDVGHSGATIRACAPRTSRRNSWLSTTPAAVCTSSSRRFASVDIRIASN